MSPEDSVPGRDADSQVDLELSQFRDRFHRLNALIRESSRSPGWHTEYDSVLEGGPFTLMHFYGHRSASSPLLIVYSQVNAPNIVDLHQRHSLVQRLIENGQDVFLLDWQEPREEDCSNDLNTYIRQYIDMAVDRVLQVTDSDKLNLLGICQGGTFCLCYASLMPEKINRIVTMVTPVDFHAGGGVLANWAKHIDTGLLESDPRNVAGHVLTWLFQTMRPFHDLQRQVDLIDRDLSTGDIELVTMMDQWVYQCPDQPGLAFAQFLRLFFQQNLLVSGELLLGDSRVNLSTIKSPVLNVFAAQDHIVPPASSSALSDHIAACDYQERIFKGGHIGLLVSKKAQTTLLPEIGRWLSEPL